MLGKPNLYYTDSHGPDTPALAKAYAKLLELAKASHLRQAGIANPGKRNFVNGIWKEVLDAQTMKHLANGRATIGGCTVFLLTERIDPQDFARGPILAAHITSKYLAELLKNWKATDIIYVPWTPEELNDFLANNPSATPL
jgi:hypothetical protein